MDRARSIGEIEINDEDCYQREHERDFSGLNIFGSILAKMFESYFIRKEIMKSWLNLQNYNNVISVWN